MYRTIEQALYRIYNGEDGYGTSALAQLINTGNCSEPGSDRLTLHERLANDGAARAVIERELPDWQCALLELRWSMGLKSEIGSRMESDLRDGRISNLYRLIEPQVSWHPEIRKCTKLSRTFFELECKAAALHIDSGINIKEGERSLYRYRRVIRAVLNQLRDESEKAAEAVLIDRGHMS